ncbi:hypothetical protein NQ318_002231 [Aromia moschata]|uniref:trypsin n=1 Tax=Aromia moschata TaxID=1265417 RepID=A0AAV8Z2U8_9CUCU|nr:hypothetical protein NQ318_002231 [Aromia moschata]
MGCKTTSHTAFTRGGTRGGSVWVWSGELRELSKGESFIGQGFLMPVRVHEDADDTDELVKYKMNNKVSSRLTIQTDRLIPHFTSCSVNKIVGGSKISIESCPYQLSLRYNEQHICGAALISYDTALTAAHCVPEFHGSYSVRAGSSNLHKGGTIAYVKQAIIHPCYDATNQDYDIAILKFFKPLRASTAIKPIRLPAQDEQMTDKWGLVTGWGVLSAVYPYVPDHLRGVMLPAISIDECKQDYRHQFAITPRMFCAGFKQGGRDSCKGDSGGPFVANHTLYGLVSWGVSCAERYTPGVYTKVSLFRDYIKHNSGV